MQDDHIEREERSI